LIAVFLLCLWSKPFDRRWLSQLGWIVGLGSLFLSQSKSSWIAFVLCCACLAAYRHQDTPGLRQPARKLPILPALLILALMGIASAVAIWVMFGGAQERVSSFFASSTGADLLRFTGRDQIWEVALQEWQANPVFGYGLTIWDYNHRMQIGMPWATHAHNQFLQSLSSAGIVGAVGLAVYAIVLLVFCLKTGKSSRGLSLALFILIFSRSISEVPLTLIGYGTEQLTQLLLLMVIGAHYSPTTSNVSVAGTTPDRKPVLP
jgi:O-antigen ligase